LSFSLSKGHPTTSSREESENSTNTGAGFNMNSLELAAKSSGKKCKSLDLLDSLPIRE